MTTVIRASSLPGYSDCSRRWAANTLFAEINELGFGLKRDLPSSIGATVGTSMHSGIAFIMEEKMKSGNLGNLMEAEQRALEDFSEKVPTGILWDEVTPNNKDAQLQVARMIKVYRGTIAQDLNPVAVERRLEVRVGEDFVLSGQSDLQTIEQGGLRDHKSGKLHRQHYSQIGSYSLLGRTAHPDQPIKRLFVDFVQRVTMKKPQPEPVTDEYDQATAEQAAFTVISQIKQTTREFRRRIETGDAPPEHAFLANPGSMLCSPKYCSAFGTSFCREHKKLGDIK